MSELLLSAAVSAGALLLVALGGWVAPRLTRRARLIADLQRLGSVHNNLPMGEATTEFAEHINRVTAELNSWLDPINSRRRTLQNVVGACAYVLVLAVVIGSRLMESDADFGPLPWAAGLGLGVSLVIAYVLIELDAGRRARKRDEQESSAARKVRLSQFLGVQDRP